MLEVLLGDLPPWRVGVPGGAAAVFVAADVFPSLLSFSFIIFTIVFPCLDDGNNAMGGWC